MKKTILTLMLLSMSILHAENRTGTIQYIYVTERNIGNKVRPYALIRLDNDSASICSDTKFYKHILFLDTVGGQVMYSALLTAKLANKEIRISGTGCYLKRQKVTVIRIND